MRISIYAALLFLGMFFASPAYAKPRKASAPSPLPSASPTTSVSPAPNPHASSLPTQRRFTIGETLIFEVKRANKQGDIEKASRVMGQAKARDPKLPSSSWLEFSGGPPLQRSPPAIRQLLKTAHENMEAATKHRLESYLQKHPEDREVRAALLAKAIKDENARDIQRHQSILAPGMNGKPVIPYWQLILLGGLWGAISWQLYQIYRDQRKE